jgi:hypothetical protein
MSSDLFDSARGRPELQDRTASQSPWGPQQGYLTDVFNQGQNLYNQGPTNYQASPLTTQAQSIVSGLNNDPNSLYAQSQRQLGDTISGKYLDPNTNPFLSSSVNDALGLAKTQFAGLYGGPAGQNVGNTGFQEQLARTLGQVATNAYSGAYGQERQNQLNAAQLGGQFDLSQANALSQLGQQDLALQRMNALSPWANLAGYQGAVAGNYGGTSTGQFPWNDQLFNQVSGGLQAYNNNGGFAQDFGGMAASGTAASIFSDIRLKDNIERIGTHDTGIGIYKYTYKGSDEPQIGVLAQEVEQVMPEAVGEVAGFKTVDWKMI